MCAARPARPRPSRSHLQARASACGRRADSFRMGRCRQIVESPSPQLARELLLSVVTRQAGSSVVVSFVYDFFPCLIVHRQLDGGVVKIYDCCAGSGERRITPSAKSTQTFSQGGRRRWRRNTRKRSRPHPGGPSGIDVRLLKEYFHASAAELDQRLLDLVDIDQILTELGQFGQAFASSDQA